LPHRPAVTVVGSANVDLVARCKRLPEAGETIGDAAFSRIPGGKGANQAVAAARLGAAVRFIGRVGKDDLALRALANEGVDVKGVVRDEGESGVALIVVEEDGENARGGRGGVVGERRADRGGEAAPDPSCRRHRSWRRLLRVPVVSLVEGRPPHEALRRACAAGAIAASRFGAQPSLPTAEEVEAILRD
jgi:sugar/nucleoside kinase (ribokinase family)